MTASGVPVELAARRTVLRQALVPSWAVLACVLVAAHAPAGVRAPVVIGFLCLVPGTALVGLLSPDSFALEVGLSIALSVSLSMLTAGVLVYAHLWSPTAVVLVVAAISVAGGLRDVGIRYRARQLVPRLVRLLRALRTDPRHATGAGLPALSVGIVAAAGLARRIEAPRRIGVASVVLCELVGAAGRRLRAIAAVRPPRVAVHRSRPERAAAPPVAASPLQRFLLDELRRRTEAHGTRRRRPPRSLANLEPDELADLLSWSSLQRFITQRAIQEVNPELWYVDDFERLLRPGRTQLPTPRGAWIKGVSARKSVPVAWRVLEDDGKSKEWRTRLALEIIDALPEFGLGAAVVAAGTAYGSLSGFRRGLEERGLVYLLRVDPVTAARELAPDRPTGSAAEAREVVRGQIAGGAVIAAGAVANGVPEEPELVLVQSPEHVLLCEVLATGQSSVFWLSNLPAETAPERLCSLVRLANRSHVERANRDLLLGALEAQGEGGAGLQQGLALVALAQGLRTLDLSAAPAKETVEA